MSDWSGGLRACLGAWHRDMALQDTSGAWHRTGLRRARLVPGTGHGSNGHVRHLVGDVALPDGSGAQAPDSRTVGRQTRRTSSSSGLRFAFADHSSALRDCGSRGLAG